MPSIAETAYPRLKSQVTDKELQEIYTPSGRERQFAKQQTKRGLTQLGLLVQLKTFQRLGYFIPCQEVPTIIIKHIAQCIQSVVPPSALAQYDKSATRWRHVVLIRDYLNVNPYGPSARRLIVRSMAMAAQTKHDLADLINVALEELVRAAYELPPFPVLVRAAKRVRVTVTQRFYHQVAEELNSERRESLDALFELASSQSKTPWHDLKQDPGKPLLKHLAELVWRLQWVSELNVNQFALAGIPDVKIKQFAAEANTLNAARMKLLEPNKRYTLAIALIAVQCARTLDDMGEMFIKRMLKIHQRGKEALERYRLEHLSRTDRLIMTLRALVVAYSTPGGVRQKFAAMGEVIGERPEDVLEECEAHIAYADNNYFPFLWRYYRSHRATFFRLLRWVKLHSTTQDRSIEQAIQFLLDHQGSRRDWLDTLKIESPGTPEEKPTRLLDLDWIPNKWWSLVTDSRTRKTYPTRINRKHFEVCLFSQILWELKSGDLYIEGSDAFADYRTQQISWREYDNSVEGYGKLVDLPTQGKAFVAHVRNWLEEVAEQTDRSFPTNQSVRLENGRPTIRRPQKASPPHGLAQVEEQLAQRLPPVNLLDILTDTEHWLNWTCFFSPISGHDAKLDDPVARYLAATFCYGCHLGPSQTARSLSNFDHRQVAWVHQRHVREETLDRAIKLVINAYNRFVLPKFWGSDKRASADGTKWDIYEQNLLAEYHIRYGGYGGIGYYHVSDT